MEIRRDRYLHELIDRKENGLIKVITGMRRVGKSYLLFHLYYRYLRDSGIDDSHILRLILDDRKYRKFLNPDIMLDFIDSQMTDSGFYYIFMDEVQMLPEFESVLLTLLHRNNVDIYVTGSNSRFLSKDIITEFRGRGDEIHVYPLRFTEYLPAFNGTVSNAWKEYYTYGGLPYILSRKTEPQKISYLAALLTETYLTDVAARNRLSDNTGLKSVLDILASSIGSLTNPKRIADTFHSSGFRKLSNDTVKKYINALEDAYLISGAKRYDVKGRRYIGTPLKYYFEDVGIRNVCLDFRQIEENHILENIIYNELRARGYLVDVGVVSIFGKSQEGTTTRNTYEIDFIASLGSKRYYIQSVYSIPTEEIAFSEKRPFLCVHDSFRKIIIVMDDIKLKRDENGITTMSIFDFLLKENSLDF